MADKTMVLFDGIGNVTDKATINNSNLYTDILIQNIDTGEIIAKSLHNKVILPGGSFILRSLFDIKTPEVVPSYNDRLGIEPPEGDMTDVDFTTANAEHPKTLLFCVGTNGCGTENSQVFNVDYNSWITPETIIPFRYPLNTNDLNDEQKNTYVGRKEDGDYVAYYFKRFSSGPTFVQRYNDGTPIEGNVMESAADVESYVEVVLTITKEDLREFFVATTGIDDARFNSISLCYGYPVFIDAIPYFADIRPLTRLNIPNEPMIDATKGVNIIYHIYA